METQIIMQDLRLLGVGRRYLGYKVTVMAVRMAMMSDQHLLRIKSGIYEPLAEAEGCDWRAIERNIRTVIHRAWHVNPEYLGKLAGYPMEREPTVSEFVEMLSVHAQRRGNP